MKIAVLDAATLGDDLSLSPLEKVGECDIYSSTPPEKVAERLCHAEVTVINKVKLSAANLCDAKKLKLICIAATGYDNVDVAYWAQNGIDVCNVGGYSSHSVAQVTASIVLALSTNLVEYDRFVKSGEYTKSGIHNRLTPVYHELFGKIWGVVGYGNIGKEVGAVAKALGCRLVVCKREPIDGVECVDIDTLCKISDIITVHTPLNENTHHLINQERLSMMKPDVILVNAARGAVTDEAAVAKALKEGRIGAFGSDVYSVEPMQSDHPFYEVIDHPCLLLTPHMAWGAYEARVRCLDEIVLNIKDFYAGGRRNRVDK